jgi:large subunit ribosomal protein L33
MAKKTSRVLLGLVCEVCNRQNYVIQKNKINTTTPMRLSKYCGKCKKHTPHKEKKKLD